MYMYMYVYICKMHTHTCIRTFTGTQARRVCSMASNLYSIVLPTVNIHAHVHAHVDMCESAYFYMCIHCTFQSTCPFTAQRSQSVPIVYLHRSDLDPYTLALQLYHL